LFFFIIIIAVVVVVFAVGVVSLFHVTLQIMVNLWLVLSRIWWTQERLDIKNCPTFQKFHPTQLLETSRFATLSNFTFKTLIYLCRQHFSSFVKNTWKFEGKKSCFACSRLSRCGRKRRKLGRRRSPRFTPVNLDQVRNWRFASFGNIRAEHQRR
jgi:hypothetical protein